MVSEVTLQSRRIPIDDSLGSSPCYSTKVPRHSIVNMAKESASDASDRNTCATKEKGKPQLGRLDPARSAFSGSHACDSVYVCHSNNGFCR